MHVVVNAAMSVDGKLATRLREQLVISGSADLDRVDGLRADSDAVMVGIGTVLADDPSLTVDDPERVTVREERTESAQPARVVADSQGRTPLDSQLLDERSTTYLLTTESAPEDRLSALRNAGATVLVVGTDRVDLQAGLSALGEHGITRMLVEGGGELLFSLFEAGLVDELFVFVGSLVVGGREAPTLVDGPGFTESFPTLSLSDTDRLDDGILLRYQVP